MLILTLDYYIATIMKAKRKGKKNIYSNNILYAIIRKLKLKEMSLGRANEQMK